MQISDRLIPFLTPGYLIIKEMGSIWLYVFWLLVSLFSQMILCLYGLLLQSHNYVSGGFRAEVESGHREERVPGKWTGWEGVSPCVCTETKRWSQRCFFPFPLWNLCKFVNTETAPSLLRCSHDVHRRFWSSSVTEMAFPVCSAVYRIKSYIIS